MMRRKPRLLLLATVGGIGGMERAVVALAKSFKERGWVVHAVFPESDQADALRAWCEEQGVTVDVCSAMKHYWDIHTWRDVLNLGKLIRQFNPDIVNLHYGDNFIALKDILAARLSGRHRCIITVYHPTPWGETDDRERRMARTRQAAHVAHNIVAISTAVRDNLREARIPARKIRVIPCGVRVPDKLPAHRESRAQLDLPQDAFIVGSLARLVPHKGMVELIEAMARIPDPENRLMLVIAGDGPERAFLEELAASRLGKRAAFLGRLNDSAIPYFYSSADVFVLPSHMEGLGLVYIEAAFYGVPSVGTFTGGIPDVITNGESGLLVPVGDINALSNAILSLKNAPAQRARLGEAARRRALSEFTDDRIADLYGELYRM